MHAVWALAVGCAGPKGPQAPTTTTTSPPPTTPTPAPIPILLGESVHGYGHAEYVYYSPGEEWVALSVRTDYGYDASSVQVVTPDGEVLPDDSPLVAGNDGVGWLEQAGPWTIRVDGEAYWLALSPAAYATAEPDAADDPLAIPVGTAAIGVWFDAADDVDWIQLHRDVTMPVEAWFEAGTAGAVTAVLHGPDGTEVDRADPLDYLTHWGDQVGDFTLELAASRAGWGVVRVRTWEEDIYADYTPEVEPNDSLAAAEPRAWDDAGELRMRGSLEAPGDEDWSTFEGRAGEYLQVSCANLASAAPTDIEILDEAGAAVPLTDDAVHRDHAWIAADQTLAARVSSAAGDSGDNVRYSCVLMTSPDLPYANPD